MLAIDEHNLEKEWAEQPELVYRYSAELAEARGAVDDAKAELEVTKAELAADMRVSPGKYGLDRTADKAVEAGVLMQAPYQKALEAYNAALKVQRMLEAMVRALEHRKRALTNMVELHLANYYSEPKLPKRSRDAGEEYQKSEVRSRGRRRRKERDEDVETDDDE
jgi:hypothetical protein